MDKCKCFPQRQETRDTLTYLSLTDRPTLRPPQLSVYPQLYANITKQGLLISFGLTSEFGCLLHW